MESVPKNRWLVGKEQAEAELDEIVKCQGETTAFKDEDEGLAEDVELAVGRGYSPWPAALKYWAGSLLSDVGDVRLDHSNEREVDLDYAPDSADLRALIEVQNKLRRVAVGDVDVVGIYQGPFFKSAVRVQGFLDRCTVLVVLDN